jgi:membrane protein implicated in regulation of membrane protease activity
VSSDEHPDEPDIGWLRAIATGVAVLVVGIGATVIGGNRILTKALGVTRGGREALASGLFFVVVVVLAWALRRLQARGMI